MAADSVEDLFLRLEKYGHLLRLSDKVWPKMYRCATVSLAEFEQLKRIENIVRIGRVKSISSDQIVLEGGILASKHDTLYVDCSAEGLTKAAPVPVFNGNKITLQSVRQCQQVFSAALIAHVEAAYDDEKVKNALCQPIPHPNDWRDWLRVSVLNHQNALRWNADPELVNWLRGSRLDWFGKLQSAAHGPIKPGTKEQDALASLAHMLIKKLKHLLAEVPNEPEVEEEETAREATPSSRKRAKLARLA